MAWKKSPKLYLLHCTLCAKAHKRKNKSKKACYNTHKVLLIIHWVFNEKYCNLVLFFTQYVSYMKHVDNNLWFYIVTEEKIYVSFLKHMIHTWNKEILYLVQYYNRKIRYLIYMTNWQKLYFSWNIATTAQTNLLFFTKPKQEKYLVIKKDHPKVASPKYIVLILNVSCSLLQKRIFLCQVITHIVRNAIF